MATALPPPRQIVTIPFLPPVLFNALIVVIRHRVPVEPRGCPNATAPPWTLNRSSGTFKTICTATDAAAKASLCSKISISIISK